MFSSNRGQRSARETQGNYSSVIIDEQSTLARKAREKPIDASQTVLIKGINNACPKPLYVACLDITGRREGKLARLFDVHIFVWTDKDLVCADGYAYHYLCAPSVPV